MTYFRWLAVGATAMGSLVAFPRKAHALGPLEAEIAARAGVGITSDIRVNPLGFGIGARGGVDLDRLYAGLDVAYYLGETKDCESCSAPPGAQLPRATGSALLYGLEAGYNAKASTVTIRPQLGLGAITLIFSGVNAGSPTYFYVAPGVAVLVGLGTYFVGADAAALVMATGGPSFDGALTASGQVGVKF